MALIKDGYWQDTYWPSRYWQQDYWPEYGTPAVPPSAGEGTPLRYARRLPPLPDWLDNEYLQLLISYLELKQYDW